jgi:hypothetical protein
MEFEFAKNAKNKVNFVFVLEVFFQLWNPSLLHVNILDFRSE